MAFVAHTAQNIESTAENLQEELRRLQAQKQALERELAAVVAHLGSVQKTLDALQELMLTVPPAGPTTTAGDRMGEQQPTAPTPEPGQEDTGSAGSEPPPRPTRGDPSTPGAYGQLTEQILSYFATIGDTNVRARDVAAALGRDTDAGSINAVRSTLDRLASGSRIKRTGRGLYCANLS
ncbi:hypothetical protein NE236_04350 [Actinoallomurus purpureus]|uniref:hypothetical protein n=1 Tax=Actinoallomurus purpureus TaxID=478114 RepID=UPI0020933266|nr:hypothetical protein [Actinoallomurus purpureus]MCO6004202.1 hypothetical protein [Actinoallomurus purpureus]